MGIDTKKIKKDKKEKKPKKEGAKERKKTPWQAKQAMRVDRTLKTLTKLTSVFLAAKAPHVDPVLAQNALSAVSTLAAQVAMVPADWKPERGHAPATGKKLGIGSVVQVKTDLDRDEIKMFKHVSADLFLNAVVIDDDNRDWIVKCVDGVTRVLRKKLAQKAGAPPHPDVTPASVAA